MQIAYLVSSRRRGKRNGREREKETLEHNKEVKWQKNEEYGKK